MWKSEISAPDALNEGIKFKSHSSDMRLLQTASALSVHRGLGFIFAIFKATLSRISVYKDKE